ncbi:MAG: SpoIIIAH-like family protein [Desulfosporosinus sp.]|nr:SpoIIIAH-like family protein [Desulfosporosinus sp.]
MLSILLDSTVEESKAQAQEKWLELSSKIQREEEIENLLKIKGFQDVVADVFSEHVTIIVYAPSLTPHEISLIQDIAVRVTGVRIDKITISAKK